MKMTHKANKVEDFNGNITLEGSQFVWIEDKNKDKVEKMIELLEKEGYESHNCPEDDREFGGTYAETLSIDNIEMKEFKKTYKRLKSLI